MGLDFILLSEKLAGIREKFIKAVDKILDASDGEPFYGRIFLNGDKAKPTYLLKFQKISGLNLFDNAQL